MRSLIVIVLTLIAMTVIGASAQQEDWASYVREPYWHVDTGAKPHFYYPKYIYREPYRYPFAFQKSYPYPHLSHLP